MTSTVTSVCFTVEPRPLTYEPLVLYVDVVDVSYVVAVGLVVLRDGTQGADGRVTALRVAVETEVLVLVLRYWARALVVELVQGAPVT